MKQMRIRRLGDDDWCDNYICEYCHTNYSSPSGISECITCNSDVCNNCLTTKHINHTIVKNNTKHPIGCDCDDCVLDDYYYGMGAQGIC